MRNLVFAYLILSVSLNAQGAVREGLTVGLGTKVERSKVVDLLRLPVDQRIQKISALGPQGYRELSEISFSSNYTMDQRWKSFFVLTRIGKSQSLPEIKRALKDKEWFLRASALNALSKFDVKLAQAESERLFETDESLMVRASALDVMSLRPQAVSINLLKKMFNSEKNKYKGRSLWIRRRILDVLAKMQNKSSFAALKQISISEKDADLKSKAQAHLQAFNEKL